ncbi:FCD domain-containing protein [Clostridium sp. AM58-1XD]|nr:FCD domain-containing protein [Clostridium sp. AM58-1XD]
MLRSKAGGRNHHSGTPGLSVHLHWPCRRSPGPGKCAELLNHNTNFHELIVSLCGNSFIQNFHDINRNLIILSRSNELFHRSDADYSSEHRQILEALRSHDGSLAESRMRVHIQNDLDYYLEHVNK